MKYCVECGTKLIYKELENEGMIPYCEKCHEYRFPIFSSAVSMIILNPDKSKLPPAKLVAFRCPIRASCFAAS